MAEGFLQAVRREVERLQHRGFLEALMAVAALAAMADGDYGIAEKYRAEALLSELPIFDVFDLREAMEILDEDVFALRSDRVAATRRLENRVAGYAGSPDRARTLLRAAHAVITCDGATTAAEQAEFERLARLLGLEPDDLALA
ncbi:hypothetical protein GCM10017083_34610 [Thalassobaculum fulvum]|uniref:Co-chaperone DjlA N-terminal domain-containing protein n=1 Tax=Thalassobaculum fulvum TaxID=1633335 RepID=A0A918XTS3_9PROT|nr:tellurite resistance TerB family protein [Thalassobaculum fulvum]GHD55538.1 hypothetical protein GCM10017083_34610 [Thalassobaculum fulvum]